MGTDGRESGKGQKGSAQTLSVSEPSNASSILTDLAQLLGRLEAIELLQAAEPAAQPSSTTSSEDTSDDD